jgi:hypothetical protein
MNSQFIFIVAVILLLSFGIGTIWCAKTYVTVEKHGMGMINFMYMISFISFAISIYMINYTYMNWTE